MKRIALFVMSLIMCMSFCATAFAKPASVKFNKKVVELSVQPENSNGYTMVGMKELFALLGADVVWDDKSKIVTATKDKFIVKVTIGSTEAFVDGVRTTLPVAPYISNGNTMIPLRFISEAFGASVIWDNAAKTIDIRLNEFDVIEIENFAFLDLNSLKTKNSTVSKYENVLSTAVSVNTQLEDLAKNLSDLKEMLDDLDDDYQTAESGLNSARIGMSNALTAMNLGLPGASSTTTFENLETQVENLTNQLASLISNELNAKNQLANKKENERMIIDSNEYLLKTYLTSINNDAMDLQLMEIKVAQSEKSRDFVKLRRDLGLASDEDLRSAEATLKQDKMSYDALKFTLQTEREKLNSMLKYPLNKDLVVEYSPEIIPVNIPDIEAYAKEKTDEDFNIKTKKQAVDVAKLKVKSVDNLGGEPSDTDEKALKDAIAAYDKAVEDLNKNIRSTYNSLKQLEEKQKILNSDLDKANNDYKISVANYEIGNITEYDLIMVKMSVLQAEIAVVKNVYSYDNLKFTFDRTYLLSSSSSSTGTGSSNNSNSSNSSSSNSTSGN